LFVYEAIDAVMGTQRRTSNPDSKENKHRNVERDEVEI